MGPPPRPGSGSQGTRLCRHKHGGLVGESPSPWRRGYKITDYLGQSPVRANGKQHTPPLSLLSHQCPLHQHLPPLSLRLAILGPESSLYVPLNLQSHLTSCPSALLCLCFASVFTFFSSFLSTLNGVLLSSPPWLSLCAT